MAATAVERRTLLTPRLIIDGRLRALALVLLGMLAGCSAQPATPADTARARAVAAMARGYSERSLSRITERMDPAMLALAQRHDPIVRVSDVWGRPQGWTNLDLRTAPSLGISQVNADQARQLNAFVPVADPLPPPARPFVLTARGPERDRAVLCLTQAIYFEAALEPREGQEAVAQTVLNRMRHPDYPHTVCGVVYQGSQHLTGCQFSFTCDGSRDRGIVQAIWDQCRQVAVRALTGYVQPRVGTATFYHADYVFPAWGPTLVKIGQIGRHIFYRFPGPMGGARAFSNHWSGGELAVSMEGPPAAQVLLAQEAQRMSGGADNGMTILQITDPNSPTGLRTRVAGQVLFGRRQPTREEIAGINARLAQVEARTPAVAGPDDLPMPTAGGDSRLPPGAAAPVITAPPPSSASPARAGGRRRAGSRPAAADPAPLVSAPAP
jgi:spore germination cell wall hydrolase CwlJ-like protein